MATATDSITVRAREIATREGELLLERTGASKLMYERALHSLPMGVGSSFQALIEVLTNVLQYVTVHCVRVLCFFGLIAKNFTLSGSLWQAKAAFCLTLV